jgi:putative holliday junction resolvase
MSASSILALDVGARRVGVAVADLTARLARPLITLERDETFFPTLENIVEVEAAGGLVIGFPRGLQGQHTAQTQAIEDFSVELRTHFPLPLYFQDEALTSKQAETELIARGRPYDKGAIDALAATYILEDFLGENKELAL